MNKNLLKNVSIMNVKKSKLKNLKKVFLTFCMLIGVSTALLAQSLIDNGDFSQGAGITYRWSYKNDDGYATYTDVSGALQAVISTEPTFWYTTGIRNSKANSLNNGDLVRVKFKAKTSEVDTQLRLSLNGGSGRSDLDVDLIAGADFRDYTFYITIDSGNDTNYKFWMHFFDAGTFTIDDIEVNVVSAVNTNLALPSNGGSAAAQALKGTSNPVTTLNDGNTEDWNGVKPTLGGNRWFKIVWGTTQLITKVVVYANSDANKMTDYTIQYWDGAVYQDVLDVSDVVSYPVISTFATIETTELRILATSGLDYRINEIEVYNEATLATENNTVQEDSFVVYSKSNSIVISGKASIKQLQIFSLVGTLVCEAENITENGNIEIATDSLPKGIYIVRINSQYTQKVIIQ